MNFALYFITATLKQDVGPVGDGRLRNPPAWFRLDVVTYVTRVGRASVS